MVVSAHGRRAVTDNEETIANGRTHTTATFALTAAGMYHFVEINNMVGAALWGAGGLAAIVIQPDMDLMENGNYTLQVMRETWQPLEGAWRLYWQPYARLLRHRSFWSHFPVIGTVIRFAYVFWWAIVVWYFYHFDLRYEFITAMIACDFTHFIMDWRGWGAVGIFKQ